MGVGGDDGRGGDFVVAGGAEEGAGGDPEVALGLEFGEDLVLGFRVAKGVSILGMEGLGEETAPGGSTFAKGATALSAATNNDLGDDGVGVVHRWMGTKTPAL